METTTTTTKASPAPERSLMQRRSALERANEVRAQRSRLKREIGAGRVSVLALIAEPPAYIETMKLWDLLMATPKFGRVKVHQALAACCISPSKTLGGLSQRQRDEIVVRLELRMAMMGDKRVYRAHYGRR